MVQFSRRGERVTDFEQQLVDQAGAARPERDSDLWLHIAKRIGVANLAAVLDEFGGEKVHVPTRENFFAALYRPLRNRQIIDMRNSTGASLREIAQAMNLSHTSVKNALSADDA